MLILSILLKEEEDIAETSETEASEDTTAVRSGKRSGSMSDVPPPGAMVSQSTICHWLTAQALENMSETNRCSKILINTYFNYKEGPIYRICLF